MKYFHAVVFIDHHHAQLLIFNSEQVLEKNIHEQVKFTRQHHSGVRSQHEFFGEVCDAFSGIAEVLVVGGHTGLADFRHFVEKHRLLVMPYIVDYEVVDHPTDHQLLALARKYFVKYQLMAGSPQLI